MWLSRTPGPSLRLRNASPLGAPHWPSSTLTVSAAVSGGWNRTRGCLPSPWATVPSFPEHPDPQDSFLRPCAGLHPVSDSAALGLSPGMCIPTSSRTRPMLLSRAPTLRTAAPVGECGFSSRTKVTRSPGELPKGIKVWLLFQPQDPGQILLKNNRFQDPGPESWCHEH